MHKGMYEEAIVAQKNYLSLAGDEPEGLASLGCIYGLSGRRSEAMKILDELKALSKHRYVPPFGKALIYISLSDRNKALECLDKAYMERNEGLMDLKISPIFDSIRSDPRFKILLKKLGLE